VKRSRFLPRLILDVERFVRDDRGATLLEYGSLFLIIAALSVATIKSIGAKVSKGFDTVNSTLP
jgi:Flp pilus assembly pilin Flp